MNKEEIIIEESEIAGDLEHWARTVILKWPEGVNPLYKFRAWVTVPKIPSESAQDRDERIRRAAADILDVFSERL